MSESDYSLKELIQNPSFNRWIRGEAPVEETKYWDRWVEENPANRILFRKAQEAVEGFAIRPTEEASTDEAWSRLRHGLESGRKKEGRSAPFKKTGRAAGLAWLHRIAAALLLVAGCGFFVMQFYEEPSGSSAEIIKREVQTSYGERKTVVLSDGSKIVLNGHSQMVYTIDNSDPWKVDLFLEGEGYFVIASRTEPGSQPFRIRTDEGMVEILGTRLVISTRNNRTRVVLEEGSVEVNPFHLDTAAVLKTGQLGEFDTRSPQVETRFVDIQLFNSWLNGQLHFEQTPLSELAQRLEETFGVKVVLRNSELRDLRVSGAIESREMEVITSALTEILSTCMQISDAEKTVYIGCTSG